MLYFADGHEMETLNSTKLLLLTKQPKLTLTDTVTVIFDTHKKVVLHEWKEFFYPFADVAVLRSENTSDKSIVHTFSLKEGFLWGIYKKKGLGLFGS